MQKIENFTYDVDDPLADPLLDTWNLVAKYVIDTYTNLPSHKISIVDAGGTDVPSENHIWKNVTVLSILQDISKFTNSYLYLDEHFIPTMNLYNVVKRGPFSISRGSNLITNQITTDASNIINSVTASAAFIGKDIISGSLPIGFGNRYTWENYQAGAITLPVGTRYINGIEIAIRKIGNPGADFELKLFQETGTPPRYDGVGETVLGTLTKAEAEISSSATLYYLEFGSPIVAEIYQGLTLYMETKRVGIDNSNTYDLQSGPAVPYYNPTSDNSIAWAGANGIGHKIIGDGPVIVSGSFSDQGSIAKFGTYHKDLIAKNAATDDACTEYARSIVEYFKDGLLNSNCSIPFTEELYIGQRIMLHDPIFDLRYEDLFVSSINYSMDRMDIVLTKPELDIVESVSTTGKELSISDQLLLNQ